MYDLKLTCESHDVIANKIFISRAFVKLESKWNNLKESGHGARAKTNQHDKILDKYIYQCENISINQNQIINYVFCYFLVIVLYYIGAFIVFI